MENEIKEEFTFEMPNNQMMVSDYLKPYRIMENVFATKIVFGIATNNKEMVESNLQLFKKISEKMLDSLIEYTNNYQKITTNEAS